MKTRLLFLFMMAGVVLLAACGDDEGPEIDPLIGEWEVDEFEYADVPTEFSNVAGVRTSIEGENRYRINFKQDFTYERELRFTNGDYDEEGEWSRDEDELELDPEDASPLITDFSIVELDVENLVMESEQEYILLPNTVVTDTVTTQASLNALFEEYGVRNFITVIFRMEKL